jgi:hypothetical protein
MKRASFLDLVFVLRLVGVGGAVIGFAAAPVVAAQEVPVQQYRPQEEPADSPAAQRTFHSFSRAWSGEDAGGVADLIPAEGRASVTLEGGVSSQMSRGQVEAVLSRLFSETERAAFDLSTIHQTDNRSAYAVGDWVYLAGQPGQRQREKVFVVLRQAAPGGWVLSELRIQPVR